VHTPDLFGGQTFATLDEGVAHADRLGMPEVFRLGDAAAADLPADLVYAGFSPGACPAQASAQHRAGARGALLFSGGLLPEELGSPWPRGLPLQVHAMEGDPWVEVDVLRSLTASDSAELFLYPGAAHLFADPSAADYDEAAAELLVQRALAFLDRLT